jgi:hypothetical protein
LSTDALAALVREYYGGSLRNKVARAQILGQIGRYGWTLWGAIQHASSPIEFDFQGWAMERFEAAAAVMTSPAWGRRDGHQEVLRRPGELHPGQPVHRG